MIYDEVLNFHDRILWFHEPFHDEKKIKIIGIIHGSVTLKQNESYLIILNTKLC